MDYTEEYFSDSIDDIPKQIIDLPELPGIPRVTGKYMCGHCGVLKKGHVCPKATPKKRKGSSARAVMKRARK
jgi:hypothetical protein